MFVVGEVSVEKRASSHLQFDLLSLVAGGKFNLVNIIHLYSTLSYYLPFFGIKYSLLYSSVLG